MKTIIKLDKNDSYDNEVYVKELDSGHHLPGFYYLVSYKGYFEEKNTWEPALIVLHFCKLINTFHYDHPKRPIATFLLINSALLMVNPIVKLRVEVLNTKQKRGRLIKNSGISKCVKRPELPVFYLVFGPILIVDKRFPQSHNLLSVLLCSLIFRFLQTSQFLPSLRFFLLDIGQEVFSPII